ncbi:MAG: hypothetical protein GY780_17175 [bacterium]|nr:hypothetical protein [bacterium]
MKTILLFIDGLGWGPPNASINPQYAYGGEFFRLPVFEGRPVALPGQGLATPIDAVLGVQGVPQSATGQTTLFSGVNAQAVLGKHLTGFPNEALQNILRQNSLIKTLTERGLRARFFNAFRPRFWELSEEKKWTLSASTVTHLAAGLEFFNLEDIKNRKSIYQDFTNAELIDRGFDVGPMLPSEAGEILAQQIAHYDFLLYEYFQTDKAGHSGETLQSEHQLRMLDEFLQTLLSEISGEVMVVLTSDHGNIEDSRTRRHTTNPVPLMVWGQGSEEFIQGLTQLDQVAGAILNRHR